MTARPTADYSAPRISDHRDLHAAMMPGLASIDPRSDADIKHGVHPLNDYQAPAITEQRALDGHLIVVSGLDR